MELINFNGKDYPKFQSEGFASQFAIPYAKHFCKGHGIDIGCNRLDWAFPGAEVVDPQINGLDALNFPQHDLDYIFSSHCLEHVYDWVDVLDHWYTRLKIGGVLFLYLPDYSQEYWRPWNNRKHLNIFTNKILFDYMTHRGYKNIFYSEIDLNNAFMIVGEK
jgi:predicted SAM-dependent methyltransferase